MPHLILSRNKAFRKNRRLVKVFRHYATCKDFSKKLDTFLRFIKQYTVEANRFLSLKGELFGCFLVIWDLRVFTKNLKRRLFQYCETFSEKVSFVTGTYPFKKKISAWKFVSAVGFLGTVRLFGCFVLGKRRFSSLMGIPSGYF